MMSWPSRCTTGRSAALYLGNYGNRPIRALTRASGDYLAHPPADVCERSVLSPRGALFVSGPGFDQDGNPGMGQYAIDAATATHGQLMSLYPSMSSQQAWSMLGVTPLVGINDDPLEIFTLADAQKLTNFAVQNHIGELSMWELPRDVSGTLGAVDAVDGSGIVQTPFQFSKIFEQIEGAPRL